MGLTLVGIFLCAFVGLTWAAESKPQYGGTLTYAVADAPPSFDAHRESTYAVIHPVSPHYSLLLKFDPNNYPKIIGDLAESWTSSADHKTYTFKIQKGVPFHDGSTLHFEGTLRPATTRSSLLPPESSVRVRAFIRSSRRWKHQDDHTVVFRLEEARRPPSWPAWLRHGITFTRRTS